MTAKNPQTTNSALVIETQAEFDKAQSELAFLEEKHSEVSAEDIDAYLARMADLSNAITVYECLSNLKAVEIDIKNNAESFDGMRLYAIGYLFWDVLIGERPECIKAQINTLNQLYAQTEIDIRTGIKFLKQMPNSKQGFKIAKDSDITPQQLIKAGFVMCDFKFYPSSFEEVKNHLSKDFVVCDESTSTQAVFGFYHYPF
ncbi:hypothetical protein MW344_003738 [Vibrio parahaemolyticus]|uniref:Uncharacterized protein n=1 Tax=Vibrio parahaemolyticus TaxID=670 RepID=A0A9Q3UJ93_VIBPH|nr:hypothetical protein [Vibrio parahaemolyticus]EGQ8101907.1 hypothetical protein [Vibrio parahaemolyticus]EGQ8548762.1 hypothetical protein [Vibrio parahaemolyticus]EGQ9073794.1 hypothetical protein [Vibrio parahaemolyticus]EGQ9129683.1 hypothetical protein [Vibrio parahaemolyticus]EGQ9286442.1 hypothetical protein [Vibrio parahaemolyticus]